MDNIHGDIDFVMTMRISDAQKSGAFAGFLIILLLFVSQSLTRHHQFQRVDLWLYDLIQPIQSPVMSDQIVIVAIDNASINELVRWPWSRRYHAQILDTITSMSARAVGIDILFLESESPDNDFLLSQAIEDNQRTVLAVAPAQQTPSSAIEELLPMPKLALSSAALGHVDVDLDLDGRARQFYLYAGINNAHWPSMALAMYEIGEDKLPPIERYTVSKQINNELDARWVRQYQALIPYSASSEPVNSISYADLLTGRVSHQAIQDKYVLIGMTATGYGDKLPTPMRDARDQMPAVEILAHELNGLLQDKLSYHLPLHQQLIISSSLIIIGLLLIFLSPIQMGLFATLAALATVLSSSVALLVMQQVWFAPTVTLIMLILAWLLWSLWQHKVFARQTKAIQTQLRYQSEFHPATGLPNHAMLETWLHQSRTSGSKETLAGLFILQFNWTAAASGIVARANDDSILKVVTQHLKNALTVPHHLAHLNGDDFALLITDQSDIAAIEQAGNTVIKHLQKPLNNHDETVTLTPYIGISIWPFDGDSSTELLRKAYTAMFKSRMDNKRGVSVYSADIEQEIEAQSQLEQAMSFALERNEFEVYYQAQVEASTGKIIGAEALLRWQTPKLGWVSPGTFIPVAEYSGMINKIGDWVLKSAYDQLEIIQQEHLGPLRVSVNLSPLQLANPQLITDIATRLEQAEIPPENLELEVTENVLMHNLKGVRQTMEQIKEQGISLAIDDFGTGYSSLKYLQYFPLNRLKIDKCFTQEIGKNNDTDAITRSIISLGKHLNFNVIAEGVETKEQANFLRENNCDEFQGYLYSKPVPADEFMDLVRAGACLH